MTNILLAVTSSRCATSHRGGGRRQRYIPSGLYMKYHQLLLAVFVARTQWTSLAKPHGKIVNHGEDQRLCYADGVPENNQVRKNSDGSWTLEDCFVTHYLYGNMNASFEGKDLAFQSRASSGLSQYPVVGDWA